MIRFFSTKMYSNVKEMDCYDCNDYPINRLSIDSIWSQKSKKITRCVVVSAYTDCEWIDQIVKYVEENKNKKSVDFRFYLDCYASKFLILREVKERLIDINY